MSGRSSKIAAGVLSAVFVIGGIGYFSNPEKCHDETIKYDTIEQKDPTINSGNGNIKQKGKDGTRKICKKNGEETSNEISVAPISEIVTSGSKIVTSEQPVATDNKSSAEPAETSAEPDVDTDAYYANCTAAREAGAAPILEGEPGYRSALDRDHDGIACE